jgi:ABC-type polysaccharide/polyol phosphate export permease
VSHHAAVAAGFELDREWAPLRTLLRDVVRSMPVLVTLARQNFYVRYRRAALGILWAVGLPLIQALVLSFVFSQVLRFGTVEHFTVFVLTGITAWSFFNSSVQAASTSIVDNSTMSTRIYFPRMVFPLVAVGANLYGLVLSLIVLFAVALIDGISLGPRLLWLVPGIVLLVALSASLSVLVAGLHVYFRDLRYIVQALFIAWFYVTPIFYAVDQTERLSSVLPFNPVTGVVLLFRAAILGQDAHFRLSIALTVAWTVVLTIAGLAVHRRYDRVFADLL